MALVIAFSAADPLVSLPGLGLDTILIALNPFDRRYPFFWREESSSRWIAGEAPYE